MSYTALYRKFRPLKFDEIVGQEHITKTIRNQLMSDRVGHAYLFNGGRGTGKTSAAKILARAVNCINPQNGEPCNECEICKAAINGSLTDIVEMDAASNNSVDDVRAIRDEVNFLPTVGKYRVYIIDEVHMLSSGAFNALLKTLEEPPKHVKFILATTEPQKLPATILSRCQRFDFKRISVQDITKRLEIVCKESNIEITKEGLNTIAILSEGALRDALSILERCLQEGNSIIDEELVKELAGIPKIKIISEIVESIIEYDVEKTLQISDEILSQGKDINNFVWEMVKYVRDIFIYMVSEKIDLYNQTEIEKIQKIIKNTTKDRLLKIIYNLSELENNIKWSSQKSIMFQVGLMKLCEKEIIHNFEKNVENRTEKTKINEFKNERNYQENKTLKIENQNYEVKNNIKTNNIEQNNMLKNEINTGNKEQVKSIQGWNNVINELKNSGKIMLYTNLISGRPIEINDMTVGIEFPQGLTAFGKTVLEKPESINEIVRLVSMEYGKPMNVKIIDKKEPKNTNINANANGFVDNLGFSINVFDD